MSKSQQVVIEGNLTDPIDDENDDSSEEEESSQDDGHEDDTPLEYHLPQEDSDEELEVFQYEQGETPIKAEAPPMTPPRVITRTEPEQAIAPQSLISAMEDSVRDLENEKNAQSGGSRSLISMMEKSVQEVEEEKVKAKAARKQAREASNFSPTKLPPADHSQENDSAFGDFVPAEIIKSKPTTAAVPSPEPHLALAPDAFGIVYRPYGKQKKDYNVPSGPAFEDEAEFERDLLSSNILNPAKGEGEENDDEFDFEVSQSRTFALPLSLQPSSDLSGLKLTTLGGKDGPEINLDGESSDDESSSETQEEDKALEQLQESPGETSTPSVEAPMSTRDAARLALAEITGIYSSGLGDHEATILNSNQQDTVLSTKELTLLAKLGIKDSAIEEVDEEELERTEVLEVQQEEEKLLQQEQQKNELESQWDAVESNHSTVSPLILEGDEESTNYQTVGYQEALSLLRSLDLSEYRSTIVIDEPSDSWNPLRSDCSLSKANIPRSEIEFPFLVAQVNYTPDPYLAMLRTLFKKLVVEEGLRSLRCPATGPHWEPLGFQGTDPCTDLNRSMKMLSVLQMLHMIEAEKGLTRRLFAMSLGSGSVISSPSAAASGNVRDLDDSWPFMLVGITMTKHSIDTLRAGTLTKEVNKAKSVLTIANEFHHACFYCYSRALLEHPQTHHAVHLASIRQEVANNAMGILRAFRNSKAPKVSPSAGTSEEENYDNLENQKGAKDKKKKSWLPSFGSSSSAKERKFLAKNNEFDEQDR